ncbi:redox-sensitive transcriptional activator SoxR [Modestobacter sp. SYSU DS0290]
MLLTIGELSHRAGLPPATLRYYEEIGLISSTRSAGGHRRYPRWTLRRLAVVAAGQRVGLPLAQIRDSLADLPTDRAPDRSEWSALSTAWRAHVDARIAELTTLRDELDGCVGCGCLSLDRCPLHNPDDEAADEGPGARLLRRARTPQQRGAGGRRPDTPDHRPCSD